MTKIEFLDRFQALSGTLAGDFYDGSDDDELIAAQAVREFGVPSLARLIDETREALGLIDVAWEAVADLANRNFTGPAMTRDWLRRMLEIWERALRAKTDGR